MMTKEDLALLFNPSQFRAEVLPLHDSDVSIDSKLKSHRVRMGVELM
jgi:hypothetical protein